MNQRASQPCEGRCESRCSERPILCHPQGGKRRVPRHLAGPQADPLTVVASQGGPDAGAQAYMRSARFSRCCRCTVTPAPPRLSARVGWTNARRNERPTDVSGRVRRARNNEAYSTLKATPVQRCPGQADIRTIRHRLGLDVVEVEFVLPESCGVSRAIPQAIEPGLR